ncbi:efflux RND transporter permease subunit [Parachitinimonas caeni]|uniref:Efflux RND transporter permease subunit n=1 Tax=Parachitinimonas caeni TaxID=3031301 RepID=A0ABT7E1P7_9NEIS|nr:efflux RND transporter permease subunit [Parachitinimonas caeni]MDK2125258.1 efflux RND transporter permease subunit [Parachitinimonas caeni]
MNLATWSIRNPIPAILLFVLLTLAGMAGFQKLGIQELPDLDLPTVKLELRQPGAGPAQLETEVARKVENALASMRGLRHIRTQINDGSVLLTVSFALERDLNEALADTKDAVDRIRNELPSELEEPRVSKVMVGPGGAMATYALASNQLDEEALSWLVDDEVAKAVQSVPGVADFTRLGGVRREVQIVLDPLQLNSLGTTAAEVSRALRRVQLEASGGRGQLGEAEQSVRTLATVQRAEELRALPLVLSDGRSLRLDQVATVHDGPAERSQAAVLDGKAAVGFQFWRSKGFDEIRIAKGVDAVLQQLKQRHPHLRIEKVNGTTEHTHEQYEGSMHMLFEGALLAVLVIGLFLRDWRATLIGATALPLSIIPAFAYMQWAGYTLNTITLLALAVVVGILVDDAIVEVENIARHMQGGKSARQATEDAVNEIALAVAATTAALIVVFLPTAFMGGVPGLVFKQFGWTIVISVALSFLVARIITPMMAVWLIKPGQHAQHEDGRTMTIYLKWARWCLQHRGWTLLAGLAFFALSVALLPLLPRGFIPPADRGSTTVSIELPPGASLQQTMALSQQAATAVKDVAGVRTIFIYAGNPSQNLAGEVRRASMVLVLAERGERAAQRAVEQQIRQRLDQLAGARFSLSSGSSGEKLELVLSSSDEAALLHSARELEQQLRGLPFLNNIVSTAGMVRQDIVVRPDASRAAEHGISSMAIADTLRVALQGDRQAALAKLNLDQRQLDIRVLLPAAVRHDLAAIAALNVPSRAGLLPLGSVAEVGLAEGPSQIDRFDRERQVTLTADLSGHALGDALKAAKALPALAQRPTQVKLLESGDAENQAELFAGMSGAMLAGVALLYTVLVLLFKDWFQPFTILSAVPLSVGGAFAALLLTQGQLNLPSLIGLVMLMGIVTKNSILVVDYAIVARQQGMSRSEALLDACHKRAQPITMTTVAMISGLLPLALGFGADASFRQPMAITVIGGLLSSTVMSLLMVPVVFSYVDDLEHGLGRLFRRRAQQQTTPVMASAPTSPHSPTH